MRPSSSILLFAALAAPLAACYDDDDCYECDWLEFHEVEPNNLPEQANWIGTLYPGDLVAIEGRLSEFTPDLLDGFAMSSGDAIGIQFSLWESTSGADFDVGLYDPDTGQYIAWWETSNHPETGAFTIWGPGKDVHLVVSPFLGESAYRLEIYVYPACCPDGAAPGTVEADGAPTALRPFSPQRWTHYAAAEPLASASQIVPALPGELIEIDPRTGTVQRQPLLIRPLRLR